MSNTAAERYINQRFSKALSIVEHLPASSSFQPTKEEKLRVRPLQVSLWLGKTRLFLPYADHLTYSIVALWLIQTGYGRQYSGIKARCLGRSGSSKMVQCRLSANF